MRVYVFLAGCLVLSLIQIHVQAVNLGRNVKTLALVDENKSKGDEIIRRPREDEEKEIKTPPLYPTLANILGAALGANEAQVNRTIDRLTLTHHGIDPDAPTTTTVKEAPTTEAEVEVTTTKKVEVEEEEDEDEEEESNESSVP